LRDFTGLTAERLEDVLGALAAHGIVMRRPAITSA
jgi:hypothetical protein